MSRWQRFWAKLFGWQYIMEFEGGGGSPMMSLKYEVKRVYFVDGWYFKKGICEQLYPLNRAMMADSMFTLMEANSKVGPDVEATIVAEELAEAPNETR